MWNKIWSTKTFIIIRSIGTANGGQSVVHLHAEINGLIAIMQKISVTDCNNY